jgi:hypothetical protein
VLAGPEAKVGAGECVSHDYAADDRGSYLAGKNMAFLLNQKTLVLLVEPFLKNEDMPEERTECDLYQEASRVFVLWSWKVHNLRCQYFLFT